MTQAPFLRQKQLSLWAIRIGQSCCEERPAESHHCLPAQTRLLLGMACCTASLPHIRGTGLLAKSGQPHTNAWGCSEAAKGLAQLLSWVKCKETSSQASHLGLVEAQDVLIRSSDHHTALGVLISSSDCCFPGCRLRQRRHWPPRSGNLAGECRWCAVRQSNKGRTSPHVMGERVQRRWLSEGSCRLHRCNHFVRLLSPLTPPHPGGYPYI